MSSNLVKNILSKSNAVLSMVQRVQPKNVITKSVNLLQNRTPSSMALLRPKARQLECKNYYPLAIKRCLSQYSAVALPSELPASMPAKKKTRRNKGSRDRREISSDQGFFNVTAFSTAESYDLERLLAGIYQQDQYVAKEFFSTDNLAVEQDVLYMTAKDPSKNNPWDVYFFREGSIVLWNVGDKESKEILSFLRPYERDSYLMPLVKCESEKMPYTYIPESAVDIGGDPLEVELPKNAFFQDGKFYLTCTDNFLQKYTFSNAMVTSIKLGIWEATLDKFIDSIEYLTVDLKRGRRIRISRADALRKTGELFALRHVINLSSDLLDTPDFYWDREELESLYQQVCSYFSINRRTKVMNEKINHCVELAELVSHNLNDAHHVRLEWMIIILIMVEVGFEIVHYMDRFYGIQVAEDGQIIRVADLNIDQ